MMVVSFGFDRCLCGWNFSAGFGLDAERDPVLLLLQFVHANVLAQR